MAEAEPQSLLDAALTELDSAVSALERLAVPEPPTADGGSDRKLLHAIFQQAPAALFLLGPDGTVRRANSAAAELIGAASGYATGRAFASMVEPSARAAVKSQLAAVGRTGQVLVRGCGLFGPAGVRPCQLTIRTVTVRGEDDRLLVLATPAGGAAPARGATAARTAPAKAAPNGSRGTDDAAVAAMTSRIDAVTAVNRLLLENVASTEAVTLQRFARLLADTVATWVIIDVLDQGELRRHSAAGPDAKESAAQAQDIMATDPSARSVPGQVAESGSAVLLTHPEDDEVLGVTPDGEPLLLLLGGACVLCAPIVAAGICYGTVTLVREAAAGTFGLADAGLVEDAAEQLARTIAVQRTMRQRSETAEALQGSLLPRVIRPVPGAEVVAAHLPPTLGREVGGDFYDVYPTPEGWGIAIGDVVGKGQDAAAVTAAARHAIRVLAHWNADPGRVLKDANEILLAEAFGGRFVTADVAHLRWQDGRLRVVLGSAGHPGPVLVRADGRAQLIEGGGVPLGIFADGEAEVQELELQSGDVLFLCTDGLTGARNAELGYFGERLTDTLASLAGRSAAEIVAAMQRTLTEFCGNVLLDDVTMLVLRAGDAPGPEST
jgi:serine phosphatase RsbU (regulator of sigma subunit)/PAS domain-containing protein